MYKYKKLLMQDHLSYKQTRYRKTLKKEQKVHYTFLCNRSIFTYININY